MLDELVDDMRELVNIDVHHIQLVIVQLVIDIEMIGADDEVAVVCIVEEIELS